MEILNEVKLAKELIKFPSITPIDAGVMKFLEKKLKRLGFKTKIIEFREKNFKPVKNLYARLGSKEPNFCFAGHLDVVPPGNINDWTVNPFKPSIKKGHLIGRGANDMKSSIAAFVAAISGFVVKNKNLDFKLIDKIKNQLKIKCSPQYIPDKIISIREVPYTLSGKKLEIPIKKILLGSDPSEVISYDSLKNPNSLEFFVKYRQLASN